MWTVYSFHAKECFVFACSSSKVKAISRGGEWKANGNGFIVRFRRCGWLFHLLVLSASLCLRTSFSATTLCTSLKHMSQLALEGHEGRVMNDVLMVQSHAPRHALGLTHSLSRLCHHCQQHRLICPNCTPLLPQYLTVCCRKLCNNGNSCLLHLPLPEVCLESQLLTSNTSFVRVIWMFLIIYFAVLWRHIVTLMIGRSMSRIWNFVICLFDGLQIKS